MGNLFEQERRQNEIVLLNGEVSLLERIIFGFQRKPALNTTLLLRPPFS